MLLFSIKLVILKIIYNNHKKMLIKPDINIIFALNY